MEHFMEACMALPHPIGMALHCLPLDRMPICIATLRWCPSMHPWFQFHLLLVLIFHPCLVACLALGKFKMSLLLQCMLPNEMHAVCDTDVFCSGNIGMGSMGPPRAPDHFGLQPCENKRKHSHENSGR